MQPPHTQPGSHQDTSPELSQSTFPNIGIGGAAGAGGPCYQDILSNSAIQGWNPFVHNAYRNTASPNRQAASVPGTLNYGAALLTDPTIVLIKDLRYDVASSAQTSFVPSPFDYDGYTPMGHDVTFDSSGSTNAVAGTSKYGGNMIPNTGFSFDDGFGPTKPSTTDIFGSDTTCYGAEVAHDCNAISSDGYGHATATMSVWHPGLISYAPEAIDPSDMNAYQPNIAIRASSDSGQAPLGFDMDVSSNIASRKLYSAGSTSSDMSNGQCNPTNPTSFVPNTARAQQPFAASSSFPCTHGCSRLFTRPSDLSRHNQTVHGINRATHLCPIANCAKSQGGGYSRADKLKEHLWKQHGDLGYVKGRA